jgi:ADP-heptose:LPS heptosyltransferase
VSRGKILVVRGGAIGDFILTLPALAALRKQFPQTGLEVLGYPHIASLAKLAGYANEIRSIDARPLAGFFARQGDLDKGLCAYFASFNIIISYLYDPDEIFRDNIARCSKAQFIIGSHRPNESENVHATEVFLKPLERLAIFGADPVPQVKLAGSRRTGRLLAVHPGSGSERKNWPEEHWQELLQRIVSETNWRVLLVGGEAEETRLQGLSSLVPVERLNIAVCQPLPELATRLAGSDVFIGHDSGITHLAAAVGLSGITLWGETNPSVWQPRSARFELLQDNGGLACLAPDRVLKTLVRLMQDKE